MWLYSTLQPSCTHVHCTDMDSWIGHAKRERKRDRPTDRQINKQAQTERCGSRTASVRWGYAVHYNQAVRMYRHGFFIRIGHVKGETREEKRERETDRQTDRQKQTDTQPRCKLICILSDEQKKNVLGSGSDHQKNWILIRLIYLTIYFYKPDSTSQRDKYMFGSESKKKLTKTYKISWFVSL